jgi:Lon protease-like protein
MIPPETPVLTEAELAELPVFPLPNAVLFPGTSMGLHIFEPRYRAMMRHCVERGPRAMAIAMLKPGFEKEYERQPAIFEVVGAGRIVSHRGNPDGTFDLILEGTQRVRLHELPFAPPFRRARADTLRDDTRFVTSSVASLIHAFARSPLFESMGHASRTPIAPPELRGPPERMLDLVIDHVVRDPERRQRLLETLDVVERYQELNAVISDIEAGASRWKRAN